MKWKSFSMLAVTALGVVTMGSTAMAFPSHRKGRVVHTHRGPVIVKSGHPRFVGHRRVVVTNPRHRRVIVTHSRPMMVRPWGWHHHRPVVIHKSRWGHNPRFVGERRMVRPTVWHQHRGWHNNRGVVVHRVR